VSALDFPTPDTDQTEDAPEESLEALREKLRAQRVTQKACLVRHKKTTFLAVETVRKGTTFFDPEALREKLDEDEDETESDLS